MKILNYVKGKLFPVKKSPKKIAIIMRAIPGSGKSTMAKMIRDAVIGVGLKSSIHSSDENFMINGKYCFDQSKLGYYHKLNLYNFTQALASDDVVISDNTNIKRRDYMLYVNAAKSAGFKVIAVSFAPGAATMHHSRNVHSVPLDVIERMKAAFTPTTDQVDEQYTMLCDDGAIDSEYVKCIIKAIIS